jgi:hypothetical protein
MNVAIHGIDGSSVDISRISLENPTGARSLVRVTPVGAQ